MSDTIETPSATQTTTGQRIQQFRLPDLGEGLEEGQLVQWLVAVGDEVRLNQPLAQIETAKALVDVPSPFAGTVQALHAKPGDSVPVGGLLITIVSVASTPGPSPERRGEDAEGSGPVLVGYGAGGPAQTFARRRRAAPTPSPSPVPGEGGVGGSAGVATSAPANGANAAPIAPDPSPGTGEGNAQTEGQARVGASPLVRKMAQERGIDLSTIRGTGPNGRIRVEDLERAPTPGPSPAGRGGVGSSAGVANGNVAAVAEDEERISTVGVRKAIAAKMMRSATTIPHFTEYGLFDATNLTALRERLKGDARFAGVHLTFLPFFVAGLVAAVRQYPIMNSRWDEEGSAIVIKHSLHVGLATDTPRGLVVPVLRNAQTLDLARTAAEAARLVWLARDGKITPADMVGGTITITNVGAAGPVETGAPLINAPEVCVVGFGAIKPRPTVVGDQVVVRPGAWISISCDHRVVDGATAAQFMGALVAALEQPETLLGE